MAVNGTLTEHVAALQALGPTAVWDMDTYSGSQVTDVSGNNRHFTASGPVSLGTVAGPYAGATGARVSGTGWLSNESWPNQTDGSIASWLRPTSGLGINFTIALWNAAGVNQLTGVNVAAGGSVLAAWFGEWWNGATTALAEELLAQEWHWVVHTFDAGYRRVYLDGQEIGFFARTTLASAIGSIWIGQAGVVANQVDVGPSAVFPRALTDSEIEAIYAGPAPATVPGAPTAVQAFAGNAQATVSWTAPADDGGSPITGYIVTRSPGGQTTSASGTTTTITGLTNGTAYTFTVAAVNAIGTGASSASSAPITPVAPVGPPSIITTSLPAGFVGQPYSALLEGEGGTPPYTWSISSGQLPPGLSLNPNTGEITGIPTETS